MGDFWMIDEKSQGWINAFKTVTICLFIIFLLGGLIGGLADAGGSGGALDLGLGGDDDGFADFIMWILPSFSLRRRRERDEWSKSIPISRNTSRTATMHSVSKMTNRIVSEVRRERSILSRGSMSN